MATFNRGIGLMKPTPLVLDKLKALLAGSAKSAIWTPTNLSTAFTDSGVTPATPGASVKQCNDVSGNGNHQTQATSGKRPVATKGLTFDQIDDYMFAVLSGLAGSADMTVVAGLYKDTNTVVAFQGNATASGTKYLGGAKSGGGGTIASLAGSAITYAINGTAVPGGIATTTAQLYSAWPSSQFVRFEAKNANLTAWADFGFGFYSAAAALVQVSTVVLLDNVALGTTNAAAALALAQQLVDQTNGGL